MFKHRNALLLGAMAMALLAGLGGCGGGDEAATAGASASDSVKVQATGLTPSQYATKANRLCAAKTASIIAVVKKGFSPNATVKTEDVLPAIEGMYEGLVALGAPKGQGAEIREFLTALRDDLERLQAVPAASIKQLAKDFANSGAQARGAGIESCGLG